MPATDDSARPDPGGNPYHLSFGSSEIHVRVTADPDLGAVKIADQTGQLTVLLAPAFALELACGLVGATARLQGLAWGTQT
jgi:hypothetical protein